MTAGLSALAGHAASASMRIDVGKLMSAYRTDRPDPRIAAQRVAFGASGHRGSAFERSFNEWHLRAITQAICHCRKAHHIGGPQFLGIDTQALSAPVCASAIEVLAAHGVDGTAATDDFDRLVPEFRVFAGTINGSGAIEVMVARRAEQSTRARVVKIVTEAQAQRSPTQQFTERFERIFVPAVLVLVLVAVLLFAGFVIDEPFAATFYRATAVLVAASPCALGISVPSAVLSGVARAARGGVLIKGGGALENLGSLTCIAFDKTSTLTEGEPRLSDAVAAPGATEDELRSVALAVEAQSDHPLAAALVTGARERLAGRIKPATVANVKSLTGRGVQARVNGQTVHIGKPALFSELPESALPAAVAAASEQRVANGRTTVVVRQGTRFLGVLGVMDTARPGAAQVMAELRQLGVERLIMISGDNQQVTQVVANALRLLAYKGRAAAPAKPA